MGRLLLVVAVSSLAVSAAAQPASSPTRVAIVPAIAVNIDAARVDALTQDLADALSSELQVQAVGGLEVRRQLPPDGVPADCVTNPSCTADVAKRTGASQLLFVVMVDSGQTGSVQVDTTWVEPATNKSASRPAIDLTSASEAKATFSSAARQLLPDAPVRPRPPTTTVIAPTMSEGVPRHFTTPAKITAAVGGVGLVAGIALGLTTRSKFNDCDDDPNRCTQGQRDSIRTYGILADSAFVIATGAAVATVVLYMTSSQEPHLLVTPTTDGAAVTAVGRF